MKEEYVQMVAFFHGLKPWAYNVILQRSEILIACEEMMKVTKCIEDDSMHKRWVRCKSRNSQ
jgi:hypothetical protein